MSAKDDILARVREALRVPAPRPGDHGDGATAHADTPPSHKAREYLPPAAESFDEQVAQFSANATALRAGFHVCNGQDELLRRLTELRDAESWKRVASHASSLTDAACAALRLPVLKTDAGYDVHALETCDVGITGCDALVAQTGSVLVTTRSAGGRALSILPPHHVVLARKDQLVRDLPAAFELLKRNYGSDYPSMISFITGPSRTGDI
ncbi:MAG TPA: lactate utilization protein, partial [Verrucomicrobiota bacterium]|nr:lactate utilization protein [Verrucomicrobiota bacterium]